jgi:hypothetical protein
MPKRFRPIVAVVATVVFVTAGFYFLASRAGRMATYYVAPNGNDANPGTQTQPFATLQKARDVVRTRTVGMTGDIIVYLRAGTYALTSPLTLTAQDSGTGGHNVIWRAYPGERPLISGGRTITGWTLSDSAKNIWRANPGTGINTRQLYVNGVRGTRARTPFKPAGFTKTTNGYTVGIAGMENWGNITDMEVIGQGEWRDIHCHPSSISGGVIIIQSWCWNQSNIIARVGNPHYIENAYELLDEEGEWYYNKATGAMYYKPRAGENLSATQVVIGNVESLISGQGTAAAPVHHIQIHGVTFAYTTWTWPNGELGYSVVQSPEIVSPYGNFNMPGAVHFKAGRNLRLERNVFTKLGGSGIVLENASQDDEVIGNRFEDISGEGVILGNSTGNKEASMPVNDRNQNFLVQNNFITKIGREYRNAAGIAAGYLASMRVLHNELTDLPWGGVHYGWGWGARSYMANNEVAYNRIHDITKVLVDAGGTYTLSPQPGSRIHDNYISETNDYFGCIYPDQGSADFHIYSNVCRHIYDPDNTVKVWWLHAWSEDVHDMVVENNYTDRAAYLLRGTNNTYRNNTVVTNDQWPAAAQAIMAAAGIEAAYQDMKTIALLPGTSLPPTPVALPSPWLQQDIGAVG